MEKRTTFSIGYGVLVFGGLLLLQLLFFNRAELPERPYNEFRERLAAGEVARVVFTEERLFAELNPSGDLEAIPGSPSSAEEQRLQERAADEEAEDITPPPARTPWHLPLFDRGERPPTFAVVRIEDRQLRQDLQARGIEYRGTIENNFFSNFLSNWLVPLALLFVLWGFVLRRMGAAQQGVLSVGKSKAKIYAVEDGKQVGFDDVAGVDEAKTELKEVVDFLGTPDRYTRLGATLPKGVLLVGPPGTGKTLLARAVAGEAGVPFFSLSGSDFVEMFVGVGAARVRDLFEEAKKRAPCIVFIDELDAIGKSRSAPGTMGGNDERENTLNQLLVEMDGFETNSGLVLMAATNRPEVLDKALLRPGRFDRQVLVDRPDKAGRVAILKIHTKKKLLGDDVNLDRLAGMTAGMAGADLANLANEAALMASRRQGDTIAMEDFQEALERVVAGLEKKNRVINPHEREVVAYHECGHAIVGHFTPGADPVQKVSIVPRGMGALGYTIQAPLEDRFLMSTEELRGKLRGLLGGRAAEELIFGEISTGAANDLEKVASIAHQMVSVYGMSDRLPNLSLTQQGMDFLGQGGRRSQRSEHLERIVDEEVQGLISTAYEDAKALLQEKHELLQAMAKRLLEDEVLDADDVTALLGPRDTSDPDSEAP